MNTVVHHLLAVHPVLLLEVCIKASLDVLDNRLPTVVVIDKVAKPRRVNNGETQPHTIFLDV